MTFFEQRTAYFIDFCSQDIDVRHGQPTKPGSNDKRLSFFRLNDEEELTTACQNWGHFPAVAHIAMSGRYLEDRRNGVRRMTMNDLVFLQKALALSATSIAKAKSDAFAVMERMVARILSDFEDNGYCSGFHNISADMFSFTEVGPINNNLHGWRLTFNDETPF